RLRREAEDLLEQRLVEPREAQRRHAVARPHGHDGVLRYVRLRRAPDRRLEHARLERCGAGGYDPRNGGGPRASGHLWRRKGRGRRGGSAWSVPGHGSVRRRWLLRLAFLEPDENGHGELLNRTTTPKLVGSSIIPPLKKRRKRTNLDNAQRAALTLYFDENCRPDHNKMVEIAEALDLDPDPTADTDTDTDRRVGRRVGGVFTVEPTQTS
ncbi:Homeobox domain containing protein, partial [Aphelenchoides avenae]